MSSQAADGLDVERVLDELITRLARAEQNKAARAALIEARRLRNLTARWSAIPPPDDARRAMLARVMDLVAMTSGQAPAGLVPTVSGAHRAIRKALPTPMPSSAEEEGIAPQATAGSTPMPSPSSSGAARLSSPELGRSSSPEFGRSSSPDFGRPSSPSSAGFRRSAPSLPHLGDLAPDPSAPPPPRIIESEQLEAPEPFARPPRVPSSPGLPPPPPSSGSKSAPPPPPRRRPSGPLPVPLPPPPMSEAPASRPSRPPPPRDGTMSLPSRPPPPAPFPSAPPPAGATPGQGRTLRAPIAPGITLVRPDAAPWRPFPKLRNVSLKLLFRNPQAGLYTALLRLDAGASLPSHRHAAVEEMYIVEGVAMIGEVEMCAGDYCRSEPGSTHERIRTAVGCTILLTGSERDDVFDEPPKSDP